jgi:hypothetical protein
MSDKIDSMHSGDRERPATTGGDLTSIVSGVAALELVSQSNNNDNDNNDSGDDTPEDEDIAEERLLALYPAKAQSARRSRRAANAFINSLMQAEYEDILESDGMLVLRNILDLESGESKDIVVRKCTLPFWEECIKVVNTTKKRYRVAAIGTPGTGKTTSTPILIRMLLQRGMTVVYLVQTEKESRWYYKFIPDGITGRITIRIFSEKLDEDDIPTDPTVYYIVDPGKTKNCCDPPTDFLPKVIIVASPNPLHWGEGDFTKQRGTVKGIMRFYPVWSDHELACAQKTIAPDMTEKTVLDRFYMFGGVPRHVFEDTDDSWLLSLQDGAVDSLTLDQASSVVYTPNVIGIDCFSPATKSSLLAFQLREDDTGSFERVKSIFVSSLVFQKVTAKFMASLWITMLRRGTEGGLFFEDYACHLMAGGTEMDFDVRRCVGKSNRAYKHRFIKRLGGCSSIRHAVDPVQAAQASPGVLFRPYDGSFRLIDFMYTDIDDSFHAFQATIRESHDAKVQDIKDLQIRVGGGSNLSLYYIVPEGKFDIFVTNPVNPRGDHEVVCNIFHVQIPKRT